jgi:hypothetical protein
MFAARVNRFAIPALFNMALAASAAIYILCGFATVRITVEALRRGATAIHAPRPGPALLYFAWMPLSLRHVQKAADALLSFAPQIFLIPDNLPAL